MWQHLSNRKPNPEWRPVAQKLMWGPVLSETLWSSVKCIVVLKPALGRIGQVLAWEPSEEMMSWGVSAFHFNKPENPLGVFKTYWLCRSGGFPHDSDGKECASNAGDPSLIPGLGGPPGEVNGYPLQYSFLENPMNRGAWWAIVHGVTQSQTQLSN